mmetsp:Transcript_17582/g.21307  ORF Transcript_17582/g.21307 Transcript_17582/m.21307 type:complete len:107 (-) Transcript_17582:1301-1621(-)
MCKRKRGLFSLIYNHILLQKERALSGLLGQGDVRGLSLMKRISQATFDEAVKENTDEFGMDFDEAVKEALEQFKSQGCDLSNISINENTEQGKDDDKKMNDTKESS